MSAVAGQREAADGPPVSGQADPHCPCQDAPWNRRPRRERQVLRAVKRYLGRRRARAGPGESPPGRRSMETEAMIGALKFPQGDDGRGAECPGGGR